MILFIIILIITLIIIMMIITIITERSRQRRSTEEKSCLEQDGGYIYGSSTGISCEATGPPGIQLKTDYVIFERIGSSMEYHDSDTDRWNLAYYRGVQFNFLLPGGGTWE